MCGIAGFTHFDAPSISRALLGEMLKKIHHRGPDDEGFYADRQIALAHARLTIIDPVGGKQPRVDPLSGASLVFNGEIYGYKLLAEEFSRNGLPLVDKSDTEVLFQLLCTRPLEAVLEAIDGMFAFAFHNGGEGSTYLARDRFGEKPLFYGIAQGQLVFGSELGAVRQHPLFKDAEPDVDAIGRYLTLQYLPGQSSGFKNIYKLPPGHFLRFKDGAASVHQYWRPTIGTYQTSPADRANQLEALLSDSIRERLVADVPVGVFLSGGMDSSLIAAVAARHQPGVKAFSIAMDDESHDESPYAAAVARHLGIAHQITRFSRGDLESACDNVLGRIDEPLADASLLPTYLLCAAARTDVKVALGGDGADEIFAGYPNFHVRRYSPAMAVFPKWTGAALRSAVDMIPQQPRYMGFGFKLKQLSYGFGEPADYQSHQWMAAFSDHELTQLWADGASAAQASCNLRADTMESVRNLDSLSGQERLQHLFLTGYLAEDILQKVDRASMYNGLEVRAPFLSRKFAEYALALPFSDKLRGRCTKFALKEVASRTLPASIIERKKHGFAPPMARLLRTSLRQRVAGLLFETRSSTSHWFKRDEISRYWNEHQSGRRDHHRKLWTLAILFQVTSKS